MSDASDAPPTEIRRDDIDRLVAWWQPVLGLDGWRISITDNIPTSDTWWLADRTLEELVVHELLYVVLRDVDNTTWETLNPLRKTPRLEAYLRIDALVETAVDQLARTLVALRRNPVIPSAVGGIFAAKPTPPSTPKNTRPR